jgi:hypothetical protein
MSLKTFIALALLGIGAASLGAQTPGAMLSYRQAVMTIKVYHDYKAVPDACKKDPACRSEFPALALEWERAAITMYRKGLGDGYVWVNAQLRAAKRDMLYCQPEKLILGPDNYDQILESFLHTPGIALSALTPMMFKSVDDVPVGFALLQALIDAFPCGGATKR